ncbi:hypothetical protein Mapa_004232 [Marchantia paleacea]|nr:hypothetical protein Mapa_004232 [Marchantia paleacea]
MSKITTSMLRDIATTSVDELDPAAAESCSLLATATVGASAGNEALNVQLLTRYVLTPYPLAAENPTHILSSHTWRRSTGNWMMYWIGLQGFLLILTSRMLLSPSTSIHTKKVVPESRMLSTSDSDAQAPIDE